ncbi:DUF5753 domain-containing protein [Lentzea alba]|uniref:DUF5753 domain-containing protein n=1 Tax=Lentzea alba TaxID=2714351 RepID=UPI0039BF5C0E
MAVSGKALHRRRLARTLRAWRNEANLSIESVAEALFCGMGTVHRMESGESAEPLRVKAALELYGAPQGLITEMVLLAKEKRRRGTPPKPYYDLVARTFAEYLDLEEEADLLQVVEGDVVNGLLQTKEYAHALISGGDPYVEPAEVGRYLELRMARQERLTSENPLQLQVVLGEAALHCEVGGRAVLKRQLDHLLAVHHDLPNVDLRVLPWSAGAHPASGRHFITLRFPGSTEAEMIFSENVSFFVLQDDEPEVQRFQLAYDRVWAKALGRTGTAKLIRRVAAELST